MLHVSTMLWSATTTLHRVHPARYAGDQLNPRVEGDARFSPIRNARGKIIPTLYGGSTFECAAMEGVFHDVSFAPGYKSYDKAKLAGQVHSRLKPGIQRRQLVDTEKGSVPGHTVMG